MNPRKISTFEYVAMIASMILLILITSMAFAELKLPGKDLHHQLEAAGTLLRLVDSWVFTFGARLLAGLAVLSAGWNLKEQRFAMAIICVFAAIMIGTVPMWVKNIFEMGNHGNIFE